MPKSTPTKRFQCTFGDCGKSFSRSEHLHRHALNHKDGNATCPRCSTHFRRKDLLDRHMARHREKDEQAGGEGLGVLATRKKLWRDADGKIINSRRPAKAKDHGSERASSETSTGSPYASEHSLHRGTSSISSAPSAEPKDFEQLMGVAKDVHWVPQDSPTEINDLDFLSNANWGSIQSTGLPPSNLMCNDIFKPDTAMSFNAPFTTAGYYDYLFPPAPTNMAFPQTFDQDFFVDYSSAEDASPDGLFYPETTPSLPQITDYARTRLLDTMGQFHPQGPDGVEISPSDPLLSIYYLQKYCDLFFTRFNMTYPLIHQATFDPDSAHPYLLLAILLLGATYDRKDSHMMAVCIHDTMRAMIHSSSEFSTRPDLWMLQTILLVECFGKSRAGQNQHDMSHLYHGLLINLIRRSDCQTAQNPTFESCGGDLDRFWRASIEAEQKRRLALLCFMWDTQHAVLFSQSLCMNASELNLSLPWDPVVWEADSPQAWLGQYECCNSANSPLYLPMLQLYTSPGNGCPPPELNALSRVLILHGLMSVSWDLNRRDQTSLGLAIAGENEPWQNRMSRSYDAWKEDFTTYTSSMLISSHITPERRRRLEKFTVANLAVYHTAKIIVLSRKADIVDFQISAGAGNIIGRPVSDADRERSRRNLLQWIQDDGGRSAAAATWHAARLFRDGLSRLKNWDVDDMFHYPWCQYMAVLTCLAFHQASSMIQGIPTDSLFSTDFMPRSNLFEDAEHDSDWDAKVEMETLISAITKLDPSNAGFVEGMWSAIKAHRIHGLVKCMEKQLITIRWAVVIEGVKVLHRLRL